VVVAVDLVTAVVAVVELEVIENLQVLLLVVIHWFPGACVSALPVIATRLSNYSWWRWSRWTRKWMHLVLVKELQVVVQLFQQ
jgi:hypothetical protein